MISPPKQSFHRLDVCCNYIMDALDLWHQWLLLLQHANGENAWVGLDGRSGDIVDMKERKVHPYMSPSICMHANLPPMFLCLSKRQCSIFRSGTPTVSKRRRSRQLSRLLACF